jgi:H+/Na+-translocating ferredoxin:NAD+ oxidoreductase subunit G
MRCCSGSHSGSKRRGRASPSRRTFLAAAAALAVWPAGWASCQEGRFLTEEEAPRAVFPEATGVTWRRVPASPELREAMRARLGRTRPSLWEPGYRMAEARRGNVLLGYAVIVEEIGKHRPITFVVGVGRDGAVADVAVMAYREAYGGEVRERRFLAQYHGKGLADPLLPFRDIRNISGATLSAEAIGRGVRKAVALLAGLGLVGTSG